jgi:hypothetical protein
MMKCHLAWLISVLLLALPTLAKERVIVLTDILNEPDDI